MGRCLIRLDIQLRWHFLVPGFGSRESIYGSAGKPTVRYGESMVSHMEMTGPSQGGYSRNLPGLIWREKIHHICSGDRDKTDIYWFKDQSSDSIVTWLVVEPPLWKMMEFVSWDDDIPNIWKNNPNVPNHQPESIVVSQHLLISTDYSIDSIVQFKKLLELVGNWTRLVSHSLPDSSNSHMARCHKSCRWQLSRKMLHSTRSGLGAAWDFFCNRKFQTSCWSKKHELQII